MIVLTGTSGFIGKHVLQALIKKEGAANVLALTSRPTSLCPYLLHNGYDIYPGFFEDAGFHNINKVIHAGAFTPKKGSEAEDINQCYGNIRSFVKLLGALPASVTKCILLSTLDVYEETDYPITEQTGIAPISLYGHSKYYCEKVAESWAKENSKEIQILRLGHVYGPGEQAYQKLIPATIKKLANGELPQIWGSGDELRSFIYIDDVVTMILKSLDVREYNGAINIVSAKSMSIKNLMQLLIEISGLSISPEYITSNKKGRNLIFDNLKMKNILGDERIELREGLKKEWYDFLDNFNN
jgi:UDP-glucose 4-epimerase